MESEHSNRISSGECSTPALHTWKHAALHVVSPESKRHTIHSYFNTCPESPDGRYILFFASTQRDGKCGDLVLREHGTGNETELISGLTTEDGHRAACQQWLADGQSIAYHDFRDGHWIVATIDPTSGVERVLIKDHQLGFGAPSSPWAPVYGPHWKQGAHRDLLMINVITGEQRTVLTMQQVKDRFGTEIRNWLGDGDTSIFFPVMSPNGRRVMFKVARGSGSNDFRSKTASKRVGKFVYDIEEERFVYAFPQWGHPAWSYDGASILEKGNILIDLDTLTEKSITPGNAPSNHPSISPDATLFVTDADLSWRDGGRPGEWGIVVGSMASGEFTAVARFTHTGGVQSWRCADPHPAFNAIGNRLYYNVSDGPWTRLWVAERSC